MSYSLIMSTRTEMDEHNTASFNLIQLITAIEDDAFEEGAVIDVDAGFALTSADTIIAVGIGLDPIDASEELLDRAADLFHFSIPEL